MPGSSLAIFETKVLKVRNGFIPLLKELLNREIVVLCSKLLPTFPLNFTQSLSWYKIWLASKLRFLSSAPALSHQKKIQNCQGSECGVLPNSLRLARLANGCPCQITSKCPSLDISRCFINFHNYFIWYIFQTVQDMSKMLLLAIFYSQLFSPIQRPSGASGTCWPNHRTAWGPGNEASFFWKKTGSNLNDNNLK